MAVEKRIMDERVMLRSVAEGIRTAHVWVSPDYPGAEVKVQYRWPHVEVAEADHGIPETFAARIALEYAGAMSTERAAEKLRELDEALGLIDSHEL